MSKTNPPHQQMYLYIRAFTNEQTPIRHPKLITLLGIRQLILAHFTLRKRAFDGLKTATAGCARGWSGIDFMHIHVCAMLSLRSNIHRLSFVKIGERPSAKKAMSTLYDKDIRSALMLRLSNSSKAPKAIIEELRVHNGNAIADVVAIHANAHCYEIKGDNDSVQRILQQGRYYDLAFKRVTLVTTKRHEERALKLAPGHWGIILARMDGGKTKLSYIRAAAENPSYDKKIALLTLWRSELADVASRITSGKLSKLSRSALSTIISESMEDEVLSREIGTKLIARAPRP